MGRNTSVSLGDHFESFVDHQISEGRYENTSEVIRAGLRVLEDEENCIGILKSAIVEGIDSGFLTNFDSKKHLAKIKASTKKND